MLALLGDGGSVRAAAASSDGGGRWQGARVNWAGGGKLAVLSWAFGLGGIGDDGLFCGAHGVVWACVEFAATGCSSLVI
ncbi:hypothetical protein M0R45_008933 [Rubus argutus]|uniref:Uncharacterized protein n=1 Tax=Rubus argutus TaxID=59490 RepID=A0AAW1Y248_RUBAR